MSVAAGAAQMGANVVLFERAEMGGDCLNTGCVPSKALLEALRSTHPSSSLKVHIDNNAAIQRWELTKTNNPRELATSPGRAVWSRIEALKKLRREAGGKTKVLWVKAHIEEEKASKKKKRESTAGGESERQALSREGKQPCIVPVEGRRSKTKSRQKAQKDPPQCACQAKRGECDKNHAHHKGNDQADAEANKGRQMATPQNMEEDPRYGEEPWHLTYRGVVCEGDITEEIKKAARETRLTEMKYSSSTHVREVAKMISKCV